MDSTRFCDFSRHVGSNKKKKTYFFKPIAKKLGKHVSRVFSHVQFDLKLVDINLDGPGFEDFDSGRRRHRGVGLWIA